MYEEWPLLEFRSLQHTSTLTLFSKGAGEYVAEVLMKEILENAEASVADSWHVETEEQLSWLMQVISYALTLSYSPSREYEALRAAVRTYVIWLSALINESHPSVPKPLKQNPQKYTSEMIDALRLIFTRHTTAACSESSSTHHSLNSLTVLGQSSTAAAAAAAASAHQQLSESDQIHITRQSQQMQIILKAITTLNSNCKSVHRDWVCAKSLHFLMNVADLLLSGQLSTPDEISAVMAPKMSLTLFDEFLFAARAELIPSPSYWRTLSVLCKRWRHQVPVLENWARKVLSLSVLIVQEMFGADYCSVKIVDDEVKEFVKFVGRRAEDESYSVLHVCWFEMLHLIGNPANIVTFEPCAVGAVPHTPIQALLATGGKMDSDGRPLVTGLGDEMSAYTASKLRQCFFLACAAISKLVDIFYGDCKVSVEFRESEELMRQWAECNRANYDEWLKHQQMIQRSASGSVNTTAGGGDSGTLTAANIQQMQATSSAASTLNPAMTTATSVTTSGGGTSGSNILKNAFGLQSSSHSHTSKTRAVSERSLQTQSAQVHSGGGESPPELAKPTASQFVWNYLKSNAIERRETKLQQQQHNLGEQPGPSTGAMLDMFMDWLVKSALIKPLTTSTSTVHYRQSGGAALSDVGSQRSMSSFGVDENQMGESGEGMAAGYTSTSDSAVTRRSFGQSTTSSSEAQWLTAPTEWPGVDGVSAGRAAAIGALCRIICSKNSLETLADCQLAQFYKVVHEALLEKDRLILCSVIYFGENMFRLGLKGIEVLLPHFVVAIDIVLPESTKLRLHPSISEVEMRRACLRALSSILSWPTVFGCARIADPSHVSFSSSGYSIAEGHSQSYIELRPRIHRILIYSLRHETDPANLHLTLAMCNILCEESCVYDVCFTAERLTRQQDESKVLEGAEKDGGYYCVSLLKTVVYEICENMCKALWCSELSVCLAAIDCINSITNIHPNILFYRKDLSTGFSIVTSLCRFIDTQLQKPPPQHSRDLHSSVVAAYMSLAVWLCAAPQLVETESCLTTIAETIEFGIYGGKNLAVPQRKAASKRVHDAAEFLLYNLFSAVGRSNANDDRVDERRLAHRYGVKTISLQKFRYFLIKQQTLIAIHEATRFTDVSQGHPTIIFVARTPHHQATAALCRLHADCNPPGDVSTEVLTNATSTAQPVTLLKSFQMPASVCKPLCKLDSIIPALNPTPETDKIITQLSDIRKSIQSSESLIRAADQRNVWLKEPLASMLAQPIQPILASSDCDAGRVFLYDMGLVSEEAFKEGDIVMLDSSSKSDEFYEDLSKTVDRTPTRLVQTVSIFYVRDGQRQAKDILQNAMSIENTSNEFCAMLAELGEGVEVSKHAHWTGNWHTAFSSAAYDDEVRTKQSEGAADGYVLDGVKHLIWWCDAHSEIAFLMPSERYSHQLGGKEAYVLDESTADDSKLQRASRSSSSCNQNENEQRSSTTSRTSAASAKSAQDLPAAGASAASFGERTGSQLVKRNVDERVFVVWLERLEDRRHFPVEEMFAVSGDGSKVVRGGRPDRVVIFLHNVETGLVRVHIDGDWTKCGLPGPLFDGCVVSQIALPALLRLTIISIARRKTVELENYQMVYSRRRVAIQEFARKYALKQTYAEFVERVISD